jgi:endonuclease YncB( thermonuclease family)
MDDRMRTLAAAILVLLNVKVALATPTWTGKVIAVADGDTITVLQGKTRVKIRLHGVDTPEKRQAFGRKAKRFTSRLVFGKVVEVEPVAKDRYGRTVAKVSYPVRVHRSPRDRSLPHRVVTMYRSLQEELVKAGVAWWYRKDAPGDKRLSELQDKAEKAKRGLWADKNPLPPWEWRKQNRRQKRISKDLAALKLLGDKGAGANAAGLLSRPSAPTSGVRAGKRNAQR